MRKQEVQHCNHPYSTEASSCHTRTLHVFVLSISLTLATPLARAPLPQTRTFLLAVSLLLSGASADRKKGTVLTFNEHAETAITAMRRPVVVMVHHARCATVR